MTKKQAQEISDAMCSMQFEECFSENEQLWVDIKDSRFQELLSNYQSSTQNLEEYVQSEIDRHEVA